MQVQAPLAGHFDGNHLGTCPSWFGRVVQIDLCRRHCPLAFQRAGQLLLQQFMYGALLAGLHRSAVDLQCAVRAEECECLELHHRESIFERFLHVEAGAQHR